MPIRYLAYRQAFSPDVKCGSYEGGSSTQSAQFPSCGKLFRPERNNTAPLNSSRGSGARASISEAAVNENTRSQPENHCQCRALSEGAEVYHQSQKSGTGKDVTKPSLGNR